MVWRGKGQGRQCFVHIYIFIMYDGTKFYGRSFRLGPKSTSGAALPTRMKKREEGYVVPVWVLESMTFYRGTWVTRSAAGWEAWKPPLRYKITIQSLPPSCFNHRAPDPVVKNSYTL